MVYSNKIVAVVKCNGKVLRDKDEVIALPFGSDYTLMFKNLDSRRAVISVSIDGTDVMYGDRLIVDANSEVELEGFLNGNTVRNKFRFIQKTQKIQDHRGDKLDDGMIRITYAFEKPRQLIRKTIVDNRYSFYELPDCTRKAISEQWTSGDRGLTGCSSDVSSSVFYNAESTVMGAPAVEEGITVPGAETNQNFTYSSFGEEVDEGVIVLRLVGFKSTGEVIDKPVLVKTKLECPTCGTKSKSTSKFCPDCGTALI